MGQPGQSLELSQSLHESGVYDVGGDGYGYEEYVQQGDIEYPVVDIASMVKSSGALAVAVEDVGPSLYVFVDDIPEIAEPRSEIRDASWALLESRRQDNFQTGAAELPPVDALSTARKVLEAPTEELREELYEGLLLDYTRMYSEWYSKNESEVFDELEHTPDPVTDEYYAHGLPTGQMTENGLLPIEGKPEEETRRVNERVEEATAHLAKKVGALAFGQSVRTLSQCPQWALDKLKSTTKSSARPTGLFGYVPERNKFKYRDSFYREGSDSRYQVEIALDGKYYQPEIIEMALAERGLDARGMSRTDLHGAQFIADDTQQEFQALLDEKASEQWCVPVFMGKQVAPDFIKDYDKFWREARERQANHHVQGKVIADYVMSLARANVDGGIALNMVDNFVKNLLFEAAQEDNSIAEQIFDKKTADGLKDVAYLRAVGRHDDADRRLEEVRRQAPSEGACGTGCGVGSFEGSLAVLAALKAENGDELATDHQRKCACGGTLHYAFSKKKVNTVCEACGAFESKQTAEL